MRVAVLDDYQNVALSVADWSAVKAKAEITVFNDHLSDPRAMADRLRDYDAVVIMRERTPFPRALFDALPDLGLLVTTGMRNLSIDLEAATEQGVTVCGTENVGHTTAELTWSLILGLARSIPQEDRATRDGAWQTSLGVSLHGRTLGILGLGKVGASVAAIGQAFGMKIIAWSRNLTEERCREAGATLVDKDTLLSTADVISVHMVLSDRTRALIGAREFGLMKPTAFFINTSRGPIVDESALIDATESGAIAGVGVDVFDIEPLPADHPMRHLPRSIVTPHLGYVTDENYALWYGQCVEDILAWLDGAPVRVLNPAATG